MGGWISSVSFYRRDKTLLDYMTGRVLRREGANEIVALKDNRFPSSRLAVTCTSLCITRVYSRSGCWWFYSAMGSRVAESWK